MVAAVASDDPWRYNAHPEQIAAMDSFVALGDHCAHAQQQRALGRPIARRS